MLYEEVKETMTDYLALVVIGAFTGFGNAVGSYLANKHAAKHMDKMTDRISKLTAVIERKQE